MKFDVDLKNKVVKLQECNVPLQEFLDNLKLIESMDVDFKIVVEPIIVKEYMPTPSPIIIEKYKDNTNPYPYTPFPNYPIITYTSNG